MATRAKTYANSEITTTGRSYSPWARSTVIRACSHLKQIGTVATCPLVAGMTEEAQPEQERNEEKHPDLSPPSCSPVFHQSLTLAEQCGIAKVEAWESLRAVDRVVQSRKG